MNPILNYKGTYRILAPIDGLTKDFVRDKNGSFCDNDCYIRCQLNNKIYFYGCDASKCMIFEACIPSIGRGRNIHRKLDELDIPYTNYFENDHEVFFRFKEKDMTQITTLLKAVTFGANISPFSSKNLEKRKDIVIPEDEINKYKEIVSVLSKKDVLLISRFTDRFLKDVLQQKYSKNNKDFDYKADIKKLMLSRQLKEYIWIKNCWGEYLVYMKENLKNN